MTHAKIVGNIQIRRVYRTQKKLKNEWWETPVNELYVVKFLVGLSTKIEAQSWFLVQKMNPFKGRTLSPESFREGSTQKSSREIPNKVKGLLCEGTKLNAAEPAEVVWEEGLA